MAANDDIKMVLFAGTSLVVVGRLKSSNTKYTMESPNVVPVGDYFQMAMIGPNRNVKYKKIPAITFFESAIKMIIDCQKKDEWAKKINQ